MRPTNLGSMLILAASLATAGMSLAQPSQPEYYPSSLPPPEASKPAAPSLYDIFAIGDVSPLGTNVSALKPSELFDEASFFLRGANGHPKNPAEAAFWLKRAIAAAPEENGRRAWAVMQLGKYMHDSDLPGDQAAARSLLELAGAWNNADALCYLGFLTERGDETARPDPKAARVWYERAKKAGCGKFAEDALARLTP